MRHGMFQVRAGNTFSNSAGSRAFRSACQWAYRARHDGHGEVAVKALRPVWTSYTPLSAASTGPVAVECAWLRSAVTAGSEMDTVIVYGGWPVIVLCESVGGLSSRPTSVTS